MKPFYKRIEYYEALLIVICSKLLAIPKYEYHWWVVRLKLIKENTI